MTPVTYAVIEVGDVICLPKPPYKPMQITGKGHTVLLREYPPRATKPARALTPEAFDAAGYVTYEEEV